MFQTLANKSSTWNVQQAAYSPATTICFEHLKLTHDAELDNAVVAWHEAMTSTVALKQQWRISIVEVTHQTTVLDSPTQQMSTPFATLIMAQI
jgi:hypothetical protein